MMPRKNSPKKKETNPVVIAAIIGLVGTVVAALLNSSVILAWMERAFAPTPTSAPTSTHTPSPTATFIPTVTPDPSQPPAAASLVPPVSADYVHYAETKPIPVGEIKISDAIKLRQFELYPSSTSFTESMQPLFAAGPPVKTYAADYETMMMIRKYGCAYPAMPSLPRIREALRHYAQQRDRTDLLPFIETDEQIQRLAQDYPDAATRLMPQSYEWFELDAADREAYGIWLTNCVGIPFPAFLVTIENLSDQEQLITQAVYRVSQTGMVMGGESGVLGPEAVYVHGIDLAENQQASFSPPFRIAARGNASFILQLTPKAELARQCGLAWLMKIYFVVDEERGGVVTDEFQLIMSGRECGPK